MDFTTIMLPNFVSGSDLKKLQEEVARLKPKAYRSTSTYNVYVSEDKNLPTATTTKGCIPDDLVSKNSILRKIYDSDLFREFICRLQGVKRLYPYADKLSSININYYDPGDSLEWHFDNADFAITLLLKKCEQGGVYEYVPNTPQKSILDILGGKIKPQSADIQEGDLMIFRGNKSLHRVTKVEKGERVLVTLNYNEKPGIPLSEKSRMTFFGRK